MKKITEISGLFFLLQITGGAYADALPPDVQRTVFSADIVASACHAVVNVDGTGSNRMTFGTFHKSVPSPVPARNFTVRLFESGASVPGCSAFLTGQVAVLQFGNPGQLDNAGVVTYGAGDGIRIDVRAADAPAGFRDRLTSDNPAVNYPVDFAAKGEFRFRARPVIPADVRAGEYTGVLSFVVAYQ